MLVCKAMTTGTSPIQRPGLVPRKTDGRLLAADVVKVVDVATGPKEVHTGGSVVSIGGKTRVVPLLLFVGIV